MLSGLGWWITIHPTQRVSGRKMGINVTALVLAILLLCNSAVYAQPPWIKAQPSDTRIKTNLDFKSSRLEITFKGDFSQS